MFQTIVISGLISLLVWFYVQRKRRLSFFKDRGIPGPPPSFLSGNLSELIEKGSAQAFKDWMDQYGSFLGFFNGAYPTLIVKDPELIKKIQIKDFGNFHSRGITSAFSQSHPTNRQSLTNASGQRWKEMRSLLSPAFTTRNMKKMFHLMEDGTKEFLGIIEGLASRKEAFEARELFQRLTADVILRSAFGLKSNVQQKKDATSIGEALFKNSQEHFQQFRHAWRTYLIACFPEFSTLWNIVLSFLTRFRKAATDNILTDLMAIIEFRRENREDERTDLLQLMLNAEVEEGAPVNVHSLTANYEADTVSEENNVRTISSSKKKRILTNEEILANGLLFFIAGFETTGGTLSFMSYLLAKHQSIQDRLRNEVLEILHRDGSFTYTNVFAMKYLDQVISETLRYYSPVVGFTTRTSANEYIYNNVTVPAGITVLVPSYHMHRDAEFWDDPDKFDPDRFSTENKPVIDPMVYQPFGQGPRNCIGLRFAQLEAKLTMAKILAKYKILLDDRHLKERDLKIGSAFVFAYPQNGIWLKLEQLV